MVCVLKPVPTWILKKFFEGISRVLIWIETTSPLTTHFRYEGFVDNDIIQHRSREDIEGEGLPVRLSTGELHTVQHGHIVTVATGRVPPGIYHR